MRWTTMLAVALALVGCQLPPAAPTPTPVPSVSASQESFRLELACWGWNDDPNDPEFGVDLYELSGKAMFPAVRINCRLSDAPAERAQRLRQIGLDYSNRFDGRIVWMLQNFPAALQDEWARKPGEPEYDPSSAKWRPDIREADAWEHWFKQLMASAEAIGTPMPEWICLDVEGTTNFLALGATRAERYTVANKFLSRVCYREATDRGIPAGNWDLFQNWETFDPTGLRAPLQMQVCYSHEIETNASRLLFVPGRDQRPWVTPVGHRRGTSDEVSAETVHDTFLFHRYNGGRWGFLWWVPPTGSSPNWKREDYDLTTTAEILAAVNATPIVQPPPPEPPEPDLPPFTSATVRISGYGLEIEQVEQEPQPGDPPKTPED